MTRRTMRAAPILLLALCAAAPAAAQSAPTDTLTFDAALAAALARDPRVAAAGAGVDAASAVRRQARAAWLPSLVSSGALTRYEEPMVVAPLHGFDPTSPPEFDRTLVQARVTAAWTIFDGGARGARIAAAGARVDGAGSGAAQARMDATLELIDAWLRAESTRDAVAAQRAREEDLTAEAARAARLVAEGAAPRLEQLRAEAELEAARAQGVGVAAARAAAEADLARLSGLGVDRIAGAALAPLRVDAVAEPPDDAALTAPVHPALAAARARAAAAEALVGEARSAWLPRVQGTGGLVEYGTGSGDFRGEWHVGVQADYPLFSGGARRARIDEARAEARRAAADEEAVADALARAGDQASAALAEATARAVALTTAVARFEELARVEALALSEGAGMQADYLRALAGLHAARVGLADAGRAVVLARARLARAQGRLDEDWTRTHLEGAR